ncbi:hypothetical protein EKH57_16375 [Halorubrum sp. BOL3-1]|uniref:hypothetical protein n=1 Tax=Halorubrum sp. BOL3-1 TaxID=2497325 RepID=UPI00100504C3|nr:hypothetical protein [Halorubrum sp. BOL3-1]QAU14132.1 hypothetical protein EKH57_16375 [Halorubrum sp. BOL3-1]
MDEHFGLKIEKTDEEQDESLEYTFSHYGLSLLVNNQGTDEWTCLRGIQTDIEALVDDFERVVTT